MIYTPENTRNALVFALDPVRRIDYVTRIDTKRGVLQQVTNPMQFDDCGDIAPIERKFAAIWPIYGDSKHGPVLFHCHGEQTPST